MLSLLLQLFYFIFQKIDFVSKPLIFKFVVSFDILYLEVSLLNLVL